MQYASSMRPFLLAFPLATLLISCTFSVSQAADTPVVTAPDAPVITGPDAPVITAQDAAGVTEPATEAEDDGALLRNGDFSLPRVPDEAKYLLKAFAPGWTFHIKSGSVGLAVEYWKKERTPFFYWNFPNGSISQTVKTTKARPKEGEVLKLSYFYGGLGQGKCTLVAAILVDGKPVTSATHDLELKEGGPQTPAMLPYTIKKEDVGKMVGVSFAWTSDKGKFVQGSLKNVILTVSPTEASK
jgi:hypothetical protein